MDSQIGVGDSKNVIVTGHVILRMRSGRASIFNGNQPTANVITRNLRADRRRVFKLGGKVGHVTRREGPILACIITQSMYY